MLSDIDLALSNSREGNVSTEGAVSSAVGLEGFEDIDWDSNIEEDSSPRFLEPTRPSLSLEQSFDVYASLLGTPSSLSSLTDSEHPTPTSTPTLPPVVMAGNASMPLANSNKAPRFKSTPFEFDSFFDDVEELASRAGLSVKDTIRWARCYAGSESESWQYVPCLEEGNIPDHFETFRKEVRQKYPSLSEDRRFTSADIDRLVDHTSQISNMTRDDFGEYARKFSIIAQYLIARERLSKRERNFAFLKGFPQPVRSRVLHRLSIRKSEVLPEEGYKFKDIEEAALFVLSSGGRAFADDPTNPSHSSPPVKQEASSDQSEVKGLIQAVSSLTRMFAANVNSHGRTQSVPSIQTQPQQILHRQQSQQQIAPGGAISKSP